MQSMMAEPGVPGRAGRLRPAIKTPAERMVDNLRDARVRYCSGDWVLVCAPWKALGFCQLRTKPVRRAGSAGTLLRLGCEASRPGQGA